MMNTRWVDDALAHRYYRVKQKLYSWLPGDDEIKEEIGKDEWKALMRKNLGDVPWVEEQ